MIPGDPVVDYLDRCIALAAARDKAGKLASSLRAVAGILDGEDAWQNYYVAGAGFLPPGLADGRTAIDAASWPSAFQFNEALVAWFVALEAVRAAWFALPKRDKSTFEGPDHYLKAPGLVRWTEASPQPTA